MKACGVPLNVKEALSRDRRLDSGSGLTVAGVGSNGVLFRAFSVPKH
jgi:hypothetical protein